MMHRQKKTYYVSGHTLVELIIAIGIGSLVMSGFMLLFARTWDTNKFILEEGMASAAASRATNQITIRLRGVRQAEDGDYPIERADNFDLTVYADVDDDMIAERVHYFLDAANDQFKVGVTEPNMNTVPVTYPVSDQTVTVMTNFVVNENNDPIFHYYNTNYPGDTVNNPLSTPASVGDIQLVKIHFLVNIDPVHAPNNINIESFVDLRNLHNL